MLMGQVVKYNIQIENGQSRLELSTLSNGIYFIMTDDMERIPILISKIIQILDVKRRCNLQSAFAPIRHIIYVI